MNIVSFLTYALVATFTPGPNNIMSMSCGINHGYRAALKFILGVFTGFAIIMIITNYLNMVLVDLLPRIEPFMYGLGALYMLYLAYKVYKSGATHVGEDNGEVCKYRNGLFLQFLNPKVILYGITITASYIVPYYTGHITIVLICIGLASLSIIATSVWALFGTLFQRFLNRYNKIFNIIMSLLLVYTAVSLIKELLSKF